MKKQIFQLQGGIFLMTSKKKKALKKIISYFKNQREVLVLEELKREHEEEINQIKPIL